MQLYWIRDFIKKYIVHLHPGNVKIEYYHTKHHALKTTNMYAKFIIANKNHQ